MGGHIGNLRLFCGSLSGRADRKSQAVLWFCEWEGRLEVSSFSMVLSVGGQIGRLRLYCGSVSGRAGGEFQAAGLYCGSVIGMAGGNFKPLGCSVVL